MFKAHVCSRFDLESEPRMLLARYSQRRGVDLFQARSECRRLVRNNLLASIIIASLIFVLHILLRLGVPIHGVVYGTTAWYASAAGLSLFIGAVFWLYYTVKADETCFEVMSEYMLSAQKLRSFAVNRWRYNGDYDRIDCFAEKKLFELACNHSLAAVYEYEDAMTAFEPFGISSPAISQK